MAGTIENLNEALNEYLVGTPEVHLNGIFASLLGAGFINVVTTEYRNQNLGVYDGNQLIHVIELDSTPTGALKTRPAVGEKTSLLKPTGSAVLTEASKKINAAVGKVEPSETAPRRGEQLRDKIKFALIGKDQKA